MRIISIISSLPRYNIIDCQLLTSLRTYESDFGFRSLTLICKSWKTHPEIGVWVRVFSGKLIQFFQKNWISGCESECFLENSSTEILWIPIQLWIKIGAWMGVFCGKLIHRDFIPGSYLSYLVMNQRWRLQACWWPYFGDILEMMVTSAIHQSTSFP